MFSAPCFGASDEGETLKQALTGEAGKILQEVEPGSMDAAKGFSAIGRTAVNRLRTGMKNAMGAAFSTAVVCLLFSLINSFSKSSGITLPGRALDFAGTTALAVINFSRHGTMLSLCNGTVTELEHFTKLLTTVYAGISVLAGKPAAGAATAGAAMLFSDVLFLLCRQIFLPAITLCVLMTYAGTVSENNALMQGARIGKWALTWFFRLFLAAYFAYLTFAGLISGAADAAAVRMAQGLSTAVPLVGTILAGASETLLSGAAVLRNGIGFFGFLGVLAICLTPFVQAVCYLLVFKAVAVLCAPFTDGGMRTMMDTFSDAYGMMVGILGACCAMQFLTVVVSLTVTGR